MRDAFGVSKSGWTPFRLKPVPRKVAGNPLKGKNFVPADDDSIKAFLAQKKRQAMKDSFGKSLVSKKIVQEGGKYHAMSEDGSRRFGTYDTPNKAKQRLHQVEYFKNKNAKKEPKKLHPAAVGAATAGGALAGQSAYMMVTPFNNHVMKPHFERKMAEYGPDSPQAKVWREWNKPQEPRVRGKHSRNPKVDPGFRGGEKPNTEESQRPYTKRKMEKEAQSNTKRAAWHGSKEFHRKFPRGLPGWRTHRALSWAGKGLPGHATAATMMGLGALGSYKVATHQKSEVKKWGYVPKSMMTPKLLMQDPGFLVPVAGVTTAGVGGTALAARKYKKRKKTK